jgi:hypothetical protein
MADVEKILDNLNIPKQVLDKSEALLKTLFAESFDELGGMIADQVRLRRFKNQIKIFSKAQSILKSKGIDPKKVSLKVLAPLIEFSSYEEEETLQEKWSYLTSHILEDNSDIVFQQNCITVLNRISTEEVILLEKLFDELESRRQEKMKKDIEFEKTYQMEHRGKVYAYDYFIFEIAKVTKDLKIAQEKVELRISNLVALGLLKWETDVSVDATKYDTNPEDDRIDVDVSVYNNDFFIFTALGGKFVEICRSK